MFFRTQNNFIERTGKRSNPLLFFRSGKRRAYSGLRAGFTGVLPYSALACVGKASTGIPSSFVQPRKEKTDQRERALRGSLTLESAIVLPLFLFFMISMISVMDLYRIETIHLTRLCSAAKAAATFTYNPAGEGLEDITIPDLYQFKTVGGLIPSVTIPCMNTVTVRSWNGRVHAAGDGSASDGRMVYVTESGTVFHRNLGCRYLNLSVTSIPAAALSSRKNSYGVAYEPCELCAAAGIPAGIVYITAKGNRYHNISSCSSLKRSVKIVRESDVGNMRACSSCGGL